MIAVRYEGSPEFVSMLAGLLEQEDVEVSYSAPSVSRKALAAEAVAAVVIFLSCRGSEAAIRAAVEKFRSRGRGDAVVVDGQDPRGYR